MGRAVILRTDLREVGFAVYELWEIDESGETLARRRMAPVVLVEGQPDPAGIAQAKYLLRAAARAANLEIVREAE